MIRNFDDLGPWLPPDKYASMLDDHDQPGRYTARVLSKVAAFCLDARLAEEHYEQIVRNSRLYRTYRGSAETLASMTVSTWRWAASRYEDGFTPDRAIGGYVRYSMTKLVAPFCRAVEKDDELCGDEYEVALDLITEMYQRGTPNVLISIEGLAGLADLPTKRVRDCVTSLQGRGLLRVEQRPGGCPRFVMNLDYYKDESRAA